MRLAVFFFALLWISAAHAGEQKDLSYFFECNQNSQCILVDSGCPGHLTAVNKLYVKEHADNLKKALPYLECVAAPQAAQTLKTHKAWCAQNKCFAKPIGDL